MGEATVNLLTIISSAVTDSKKKCLLQGVSGVFKNGQLSAIMGPSGSLNDRKNDNNIYLFAILIVLYNFRFSIRFFSIHSRCREVLFTECNLWIKVIEKNRISLFV